MTPRVVALELPIPPSANRWWRKWRNRMVKSTEALEYQAMVQLRLVQVGVPFRQPTHVSLRLAWYRARRSGDLDKRLGVLLDALQGVVYESDAQITHLEAWRVDGDRPRIELIVQEASRETFRILAPEADRAASRRKDR